MELNQIIEGDALTILKTMPDKLVQTCISSPPYWGLRDYGTAEWEGGDPGCDHKIPTTESDPKQVFDGSSGSHAIRFNRINCHKCGAIRIDSQLGLEATPEIYVAKMVEIFAEVRRVLRDDGTLWLNLGDSYATSGSGRGQDNSEKATGEPCDSFRDAKYLNQRNPKTAVSGLKPKDLCGIPWRVAFALQADGWYLRSDIIWSKPNPMPESCTDRPTKAHEYLFLLTKSGTSQYWTHRDKNGTRKKPKADWRWVNQIDKTEIDYAPEDWKKIVPCLICDATGKVMIWDGMLEWPDECPVCKGERETQLWKRMNLWQGHDYYYDADAIRENYSESYITDPRHETGSTDRNMKDGYDDAMAQNPKKLHKMFDRPVGTGRNRRSVWEIATQPYPQAHFATFPEKLVLPCILAGSNDRACGICGAAWEREIDKETIPTQKIHEGNYDKSSGFGKSGWLPGKQNIKTLGFRPTCEHDNGDGRSIILDPFMGSGTVALVALKHGRDYIGIELKPDYIAMAMKRLKPLGNRPLPQQEVLI